MTIKVLKRKLKQLNKNINELMIIPNSNKEKLERMHEKRVELRNILSNSQNNLEALKELNAAIAHLSLVPNCDEEKLARMHTRRAELIKIINEERAEKVV
jgi:hypothetical protein